MEIIIGIITAVFLVLIAVIISQATRIGTLESSSKNEYKRINSLVAEIDVTKKKHEETISSFNQERECFIKEIEHLKSSENFTEPVQAKGFNVFE